MKKTLLFSLAAAALLLAGCIQQAPMENQDINQPAADDDRQIEINDRCKLLPETGPCKAMFKKYYFNQEKNKCDEFVWGGCRGVVPFETLEECNRACSTCFTAGGQAGFIMHDGNCYAPGENVFDTDCIVSKDGGCLPLGTNTAAIAQCLRAGGTDDIITECDGSQNTICDLPGGDVCYIENLVNGACKSIFSPKMVCD